MSATTETQSPSEKHLATLNQILLLLNLPAGILGLVLTVYGKQLGASAVEIGLLFSVYSLTSLLARPLVGDSLDRYGRRWFLIGGLITYSLAMIGYAFSSKVIGLVITRVPDAIAIAILGGAVNAIVSDLAGAEDRGKAFGNVNQSSTWGSLIGITIGFYVLFNMIMETGWMLLFLFYAAAILVSAGIAGTVVSAAAGDVQVEVIMS
jgi:MFS family permease